ncbi:MAG: ABC transporter ATP-binding protein [Spirochaetaceae bacterium]|jgi:peptide/nickel transport system ATP-binding protein/oligopeptide transport system ATP-binding protein|nr:ABC transporter ATP-binding protein [Spirochaetaceae bacterium]
MRLFEIQNLYKCFDKRKKVYAVRNISLHINRGETIGLVGESGCGKTTLGKLLIKLENTTAGSIIFKDEDITHHSFNKMRRLRQNMQMIFQSSAQSFNPYCNIRQILTEPLNNYSTGTREEKERLIVNMLCKIGLDKTYLNRYPRELSGGQRQRIGIARALILNPEFVVCDEAVSSIDYVLKQKILALLKELKQEFDLTYLFISHDISAIKTVCTRVAVMYLGNILEIIPDISLGAVHPYTQALLAAVLPADPAKRKIGKLLFRDNEDMDIPEQGCVFQNRCLYAQNRCREKEPELVQIGIGHFAACYRNNIGGIL